MTAKTKNWTLGVLGMVVGTVLCFGLAAWLGHFKASAQTASTGKETAEIVDKLVVVVDKLANIHEAEDAGLRKAAELCHSGKLSDCDECAAAGVELRKCSQ